MSFCSQRLAEQPSLGCVTPLLAQKRGLCRPLDPLGNQVSPRACPNVMIALTMAAEDASWSIRETKDWSIFRMLTSVCWSWESDECPVPKSSMDSRTPRLRNAAEVRARGAQAVQQRGLGDLHGDLGRGDGVVSQGPGESIHGIVLAQGAR